AIRIIPYLVAILVAIGMLRAAFEAAAKFDWFTAITGTLQNGLNAVGFPPELLPLALMRPLSGSGSNGIFNELIRQVGPDSMIARMAGTIMGSTETTFYVIAVYFGSVAVRRTRHAVPAGLLADIAGTAPVSEFFKLAAVCDMDEAKASQYAEQYQVKAYTSLEALLADSSIQVVGLFTGPAGRSGLLRKIIRAGKDVMTTKPFELDPVAARQILEEAKSLGRIIHLNSPGPRLTGYVKQVKAWQEEYQLGRPVYCRGEVVVSYREKADGGWLDDPERCPAAPIFRLGIYIINDLVRLFGSVRDVQIQTTKLFTERPTPDNAQLGLTFNNGALGHVFATFCVDTGQYYANSLILHYEKGSIYRNLGPFEYGQASAGSHLKLVTVTPDKKVVTVEWSQPEGAGSYQWKELFEAIRHRDTDSHPGHGLGRKKPSNRNGPGLMMIRVGLYGINGHQIHASLENNPLAVLSAISLFPEDKLPPALREDSSLHRHGSLDEMLADPEVDFISLCSPSRKKQARDAIQALQAGKHVLAEKPCAMTEEDLDEIILTARETGKIFHEMAGTAFSQPYYAMRRIVESGQLGQIVQVLAEKSYPYYEGRAQDEDEDGGQIGQNGIHALRFVEHVACTPIASIRALETIQGNPVQGGGLRMAASLLMGLKNGGIAGISSNYLNPRGTGIWGDESLKILGTLGMVESRAGGKFTRLVIGEKDFGPLDLSSPGTPWLETFLETLLGRASMPLTLEEELSPTRWTIRAKNQLG
ncbi:hypothetical protein FGG08_007384, partial [Glutinoglossum americanum]